MSVRPTRQRERVQIGQRSVAVSVDVLWCEQCGATAFTPEQFDQAQRAASDAIRDQEGLLHGDEIRRIRDAVRLSQAQFERLLGVGPKTVVRWEKGTVFQNRATDLLIRLVDQSADAAGLLAQWNAVTVPTPASPTMHAPTVTSVPPPTPNAADDGYERLDPLGPPATVPATHRRKDDDVRVFPIQPKLEQVPMRDLLRAARGPDGVTAAGRAHPTAPSSTDAGATELLNAYVK